MITSLLKQAYAMDIELWTENGKLKYRAAAGSLTDDLKQQLIDSKDGIIRRLEENIAAKSMQWMIHDFGEMYGNQTSPTSELCIFRNDDQTFTVWRGTWRPGEQKPFSEKTIVNHVSFQEAFDRANNYRNWITNKNKQRKAS
jgi:hypothetical protein